MDRAKKIRRYIELHRQSRIIGEEMNTIKKKLAADTTLDKVQEGKMRLTRSVTRIPKLKSNVDEEEVKKNFPQAVKTTVSIDMKALEVIPEAFDLIEITESPRITVKEIKGADTDDF